MTSVLAVCLFAGYFAFSTFLFSPFESGLGVDVAGLVPREVDVFLARSELGWAFDGFPRLAVQDRLDGHPSWKEWSSSSECTELSERFDVEGALAELSALTDRLPMGLEPLDVFGGRDLALAARFGGTSLEEADWAVYGTLHWTGKLAVSLLRHPGLLGLEGAGLSATVEADHVRLSGSGLGRELFVTRVRDVAVIATSRDFVDDAHRLEAVTYEDSMLLRAEYGDHIKNVERSPAGDELEFFVKVRDLLAASGEAGAWPDITSVDFAPAFLGRFFQANTVNLVVGQMGLDEGLSVDARARLSSELMTPLQMRCYRRPGADRAEIIEEAAALAPEDASFFLYVKTDIGDLLEQVVVSLEPDTVQLIEESLQSTGQYRSLQQLIDELRSSLRDRFAIILRPNDYPVDPDGPELDGQPVFAMALVTWIKKGRESVLVDLRDTIGRQGKRFGLRGKTENDSGYYRNQVGGYEIREFWAPLVPGTGMIATANARIGDTDQICVVANCIGMLEHVLKTRSQGAPTHPRLAGRGDFRSLLATCVARANLVAWCDPQSAQTTLRRQARRWAEDSIQIDWSLERARLEQQAINEIFAGLGKQRGRLSEEEQARIDRAVEPGLDAIAERVAREQVPAVMAAYERRIVYSEGVTAALMLLGFDPKHVDVSLRIDAPLP
ncbi:MAG: hypothetical protein QF860_09770 [Planctomycetota bacterium]|nr:hypothetical protein [Planctomycetota bacterium]